MNNDTTLPPGMHRETNEIPADDATRALEEVAVPIIQLMNEHAQKHGAITALYGLLYAAGAALASYGAALDEGIDLRMQLSPLFEGYNDTNVADSH